jgi:hypothetical protein
MDKTTTQLRVMSQKIVPFEYGPSAHVGEAVEVRANGTWKDDTGQEYPISLHITLHPGSAILPANFGDQVTITVGRSY